MSICQDDECPFWESDKEECDDCVDGRDINVVCQYASTCDGCSELMSHDSMIMDNDTQLGYCDKCAKEIGLVDEKVF